MTDTTKKKGIEIVKGEVPDVYRFLFDGHIFTDDEVRAYSVGDGLYAIDVKGDTLSQMILALRFSDLPRCIWKLSLIIEAELVDSPVIYEDTYVQHDEELNQFSVNYRFDFGYDVWKHAWSIADYVEEFERILTAGGLPGYEYEKEDEVAINGFIIRFPVLDTTLTIEDEFSIYTKSIQELHNQTQVSLTSKLHKDSVVMQFDFPEEVRVPCEQYLLYFAQFLRDLGVQADTALTHEAGQVLFTVTPEDKEQALDKIRAALDAYLHLPSNPISDASNESIAIQRCEVTILRLRSDLKLASAELQAKNTTIEAQQLIIEVQKGLLSGEVVFNSMKDVTPKPQDKDKEELLGDIVSLVPIKGKGVEVNLPELFRRLKQLFKKEE